MIVGVYGIGYIIAAGNPYKHWPIIFVGLLRSEKLMIKGAATE